MVLNSNVLHRLKSSAICSQLAPLVIDNWILFQRKTFDHFDENGDPYISQVFLVEISTGRYIHRAQGHKVDQGTTLDPDVLENKLMHVFLSTKPCSGFPLSTEKFLPESMTVIDYPYRREVSKECQFYVQGFKLEPGDEESKSEPGSCCAPCLEASNQTPFVSVHVEGDANNDELVPVLESRKSLTLNERKPHMTEFMEFDSEMLETDIDDLWPAKDDSIPIEEAKPNDNVEVSKKGYKCTNCSQVFETHSQLRSHRWKRNLKQRNNRKVGCLECNDTKIVTFKHLRDHVALKHPDKLGEYQSILPEEPDANSMKHPLKCSLCNWINNGTVLTFRHRELYHELGNHVCGDCQEPNLTYYDLMIHNYKKHFKATKPLALATHGLDMVIKDGKVQVVKTKIVCPMCLKEYKNDYGMIDHLRKHHSWGMFNCESCGEACHFAKDISAHMIQFHGDNPELKCPTCFKDFNLNEDPELFNAHYKTCYQIFRKGESRSSFQCHVCGKQYLVKRNLDLHMNIHQGILPFKCTYCAFGTIHKSVLKDHERSHLAKRALKDGTSTKSVLHQCEQCGKQMKSVKLLKRHVRVVHEGRKQSFECKDCGEIFKHYVALYKHKKHSHGFVSNYKHIE
ncbi:hypothetical protein TCAL_12063, partial [Tigriopus californicus]|eukprot:TCALIF_12063-PA protein Name:"Similar to ZNF814 Putative uncharacterized zinc finger protein 814 (Homo sapiens)" AED:0.37 eAED:0.37 QI:89/1/0.5/1/1/1/2/0/623